MNLQIIIFTFIGVLAVSLSVAGVDVASLQAHTIKYNDPFVDEHQVVCDALKTPEETEHEKFYKLSNSSGGSLGYDDMLKLTVWNMKRGFKYRSLEYQLNFPQLSWRKQILDDIFDIFKLACHNAYVPAEFLNIIYEMVMIYYNNIFPIIKEPEPSRWNSTSDILERCKSLMHQLPLHDIAGTIDFVAIGGREVHLNPPAEMADSIPNLDVFIETLWWAFSFSYGACYYPAGYRSVWAPKYKKLFYEDFIHPLIGRWVNSNANYGVMIGNFDVESIMQNVRSCTHAAYAMYSIHDRELVRPLRSPDGVNYKTGDTILDHDGDELNSID